VIFQFPPFLFFFIARRYATQSAVSATAILQVRPLSV